MEPNKSPTGIVLTYEAMVIEQRQAQTRRTVDDRQTKRRKAKATLIAVTIAVVVGIVCWSLNVSLTSGPAILEWVGWTAETVARRVK